MVFHGDNLVEQLYATYHRGITIQAPPLVVFRWLCQLRVAPYSYDLLDNLGRRSPRTLTPSLEELAIGQHFLVGFELVYFEDDHHLTLRTRPKTIDVRLFGDFVFSYLLVPQTSGSCRLLVKETVRYRGGPIGWVTRVLFPWVDLIMMRRQLLNLKKLSEEMVDSM